jgi:YD repeat-containing protein
MRARIRRRRTSLAVLGMACLGILISRDAESGAVTYGYDPSGRITTALYDNGLCTVYAYDASGNRTSQINFGPPQTPPPLWGSPSWGSFNWSSAPQWPAWTSGGVWGCFLWTPQ